MLKRLLLKSKNYLYVFHTGDFTGMKFMGMTEEAYSKAKGTFKVWCFPSTRDTLESTIAEIEEDFYAGETYGKDCMNISKGVKKEDAINCANEFYKEAINCDKIKDLQVQYYLVDKASNKGILYEKFNKLTHYSSKMIEILPRLNTNVVVDLSLLLEEDMNFGKKSTSFGKYISRCYNGDSRYCVVGVAENSNTTIVDLQLNVTPSTVADFDSLEELFFKDYQYSFRFNKDCYFLS